MARDLKKNKDQLNFYICGQCKDKIYHDKTEEAVIPCPDCGWAHKDHKKYDLPNKIKLDISQY